MTDLKTILKSSENRMDYTMNLEPQSLNQKDREIIRNFIRTSFRNYRNLGDAFELSELIKYVDENSCKIAKSLMKRRIKYILKLSILDFALANINTISKKCYDEINRLGMQFNNSLVKLQSEFNNFYKMQYCIDKLVSSKYLINANPQVYYRLLNNLSEYVTYARNINSVRDRLSKYILSSQKLSNDQKRELLGNLDGISLIESDNSS